MLEKYTSYKLISKHCPSLASLCASSEKRWARMDLRANDRYTHFSNRLLQTGEFRYETHILDLILLAEKENDSFCISFLRYLDGVFGNIENNIPNNIKNQLNAPLFDLLENFDNNQSRYLDRLGEFLNLERFLLSADLVLERIEVPTIAGTSLDFQLCNRLSKEIIKVEVMNVHLDAKKLQSEYNLKHFFGARLAKKYEAKKLPQPPDSEIAIVLVLWGDFLSLVDYEPFFSDQNSFDGYPIIFTNLTQYRSSEYEWLFKFNTTGNILKEYITKTRLDGV